MRRRDWVRVHITASFALIGLAVSVAGLIYFAVKLAEH